MNRDELINIVKVKMDEISPFDEEEMVSSTLVETLIDFAANNVVRLFPERYLPSTSNNTIPAHKNSDGSGYIDLPDDFQRFLRLKMDKWERPVSEVITEADPKYAQQFNKWIRGGVAFPVVALKADRIEYFSVPSGEHKVESFAYVKRLKAEQIPDTLVDAMTWEAARLAFDSLQDAQSSAVCTNNFGNLLKVSYEGSNTSR